MAGGGPVADAMVTLDLPMSLGSARAREAVAAARKR
jgi:hypothetical protein